MVNFNLSLVLQLLNTLILYLVLRRYFFKPILNIIEKRKALIEKNIDESESKKKEAQKIKEEYINKLNQTCSEARKMLDRAENMSKKLSEDLKEQAEQDAEAIRANARKEVEREHQREMLKMHKMVLQLSLTATKEILNKEIDETAHRKLIDSVIENQLTKL